MKIIKVCLFNDKNEIRVIDFKTSGLNIITGASKRGKSSILDIVEYCLGSNHCNIPYGHIRDYVSWFAILLKNNDQEIFIARKKPEARSNVSNEFYLSHGKKIDIDNILYLEENSNQHDILSFLSKEVGMYPHITEVPQHQTRPKIDINFKHSLYLYFQNQDELASKKLIFHRQSEQHMPQVIIDTIPYFIGAIENGRLSELEKLRQLKRELATKKNKHYEINSLIGDGLAKGNSLLNQAKALRLYKGDGYIKNISVILENLKKIEEWTPSPLKSDDNIDQTENLDKLQKSYEKLSLEKRILNSKVVELRSYALAVDEYSTSKNEQLIRLKSIEIYKKTLENTDNEYIDLIRRNLLKLEQELEDSSTKQPRISDSLNELEKKQKEIALDLKSMREQINLIRSINFSSNVKKEFNNDIESAKIVGKASLYLESLESVNSNSYLRNDIERLENLISGLEQHLNPTNIQELLESQINFISEDITKWSRELQLEHSEYPIKLDIKKLTISADTPKGRIPLYQMGSGENWVGYHLVTHVALAKWFAEQKRPVANFLFFDQPSQVYFPSDKSTKGNLNEIEKDEDRVSARRMFKWLYDVCKYELKDKVQIIVTDHAHIHEDWFEECIRDVEWRGFNALIPLEWYQS